MSWGLRDIDGAVTSSTDEREEVKTIADAKCEKSR